MLDFYFYLCLESVTQQFSHFLHHIPSVLYNLQGNGQGGFVSIFKHICIKHCTVKKTFSLSGHSLNKYLKIIQPFKDKQFP